MRAQSTGIAMNLQFANGLWDLMKHNLSSRFRTSCENKRCCTRLETICLERKNCSEGRKKSFLTNIKISKFIESSNLDSLKIIPVLNALEKYNYDISESQSKKIYVDIFKRKWQTTQDSQGGLWNNPPGVVELKTKCNSEYTSVKHNTCNNKKRRKSRDFYM